CWPPSATGPRSTGCSTATPVTWRAGGGGGRGGPRGGANPPPPGRGRCPGPGGRARSAARGRGGGAGGRGPLPGGGGGGGRRGGELLMEFLGEPDGTAAPRLAQLRPGPDELADLWHQLDEALVTLAGHGLAHGDLSAFNLLVHRGRLVLIDLPQVVDVVANPRGGEFLDRDAQNVANWFSARGLASERLGEAPSPGELAAVLRYEARRGSPAGRR